MTAARRPTRLAIVIKRYLALKRSLGRAYQNEENVLDKLEDFVARESRTAQPDLTPEVFAAWCRTQQHITLTVRRNRMRIVRNLCLYRQRTEPACFVPDTESFPRKGQSVRPYFFTEGDVVRLLNEADKLEATSGSPLRSENYRVAVVLLFTAGLRRGELVRLTLGDINEGDWTLTIRESKFHKSRIVPLSTSTSRELASFLVRRQQAGAPRAPAEPLLWNRHSGGQAYTGAGLAMGLRALMASAGIRKPDGRVPRVHDFRHAFAANALLRWYRADVDITAKLPHLATYMGHVSIVSTQQYVQFADELAEQASLRFERLCGELVDVQSGGEER